MSRQHLDSAFTALHRIQLMQSLAFAAQNEVDSQYHIVDYADTIDASIKQLQVALDDLERSIAA
jgi:hypothetical protein